MTVHTLPNVATKAGFLDTEAYGANMNRNLRVFDAMIQPRVVDKDLTAPPGSPVEGAVYIVGAAATGAWAGHVGELAIWTVGDDITSAWQFVTPKSGFQVWVIDESLHYEYSGTAWGALAGSGVTRYAANFGDGSANTFNITHNLGSRDVQVAVYRNATPWETQSGLTVGRPDINTISLSGFSVAPSASQFRVVVFK